MGVLVHKIIARTRDRHVIRKVYMQRQLKLIQIKLNYVSAKSSIPTNTASITKFFPWSIFLGLAIHIYGM